MGCDYQPRMCTLSRLYIYHPKSPSFSAVHNLFWNLRVKEHTPSVVHCNSYKFPTSLQIETWELIVSFRQTASHLVADHCFGDWRRWFHRIMAREAPLGEGLHCPRHGPEPWSVERAQYCSSLLYSRSTVFLPTNDIHMS